MLSAIILHHDLRGDITDHMKNIHLCQTQPPHAVIPSHIRKILDYKQSPGEVNRLLRVT